MGCKIVFLVQICMILSFGWVSMVEAAAPTFLVPIGSTLSRPVREDATVDTSILTVEGQDTDGDSLAFSIVTQTPNKPPFELGSLDGLLKVPSGLDAETSQWFTFTFGVNDGAQTVNSIPFIVNITDVNEFTPVFNPTSYTATILDSVSNGYVVTTVNATDNDVTATITYSIVDTTNTFTVDSSNGTLTVKTNTNLNAITTPTYTLTIQASDDTNTATATVTITVTEDFCSPNPCLNGNCSLTGNTYSCTCTPGYTGQNCSQEDFCYPAPCQNGATCVTSATEYTCNCAAGFIGQNCSQVDYCFSSPCLEGSTCILSNTTNYTCNCVEGYLGRNCDQVDYCFSGPCLHGSTCLLSDTMNYTCNCVEGYLGRNCDQVDYCATNPCQNGGTCTNSGSSYVCTCVSGYTGTNCTDQDTTGGDAGGSGGGSTSIWLIARIVLVILVILIVVLLILHRHKKINLYKLPCCSKDEHCPPTADLGSPENHNLKDNVSEEDNPIVFEQSDIKLYPTEFNATSEQRTEGSDGEPYTKY